jgi:hypothetical protein
MARVFFVTGFNRSGTTLVTSAVTEATGGATLTAGHLARHIPTLERFLVTAKKRGAAPDRGVDRLPVSESTPEEYGWLLQTLTGEPAFGEEAARSGALEQLIEEVADAEPGVNGSEPVVVLKNPWDTGREQLLLGHVEGSVALLVRRQLGAIEDSQARAWSRMATSNRYLRALIPDRRRAGEILSSVLDPAARQRMIRANNRQMRRDVLRLARIVSMLPPDRVAFLSYDELRADPRAGAAWAAHLLDPDAMAKAVAAHTFPEYNHEARGSLVVRAIDRYWARAWRRARARQVKAGILAPRR